MPTHLETLAAAVGVPAEDLQTVASLKDTDTFDPKPIVEKVKGNFKTQFKNDASFYEDLTADKLPEPVRKKFESDGYGRATGIVKQKFQKVLGLTDDDLSDMTEEQRSKFEEFVTAAATKYANGKAAGNSDKVTQQKLIEAIKKYEALEAENTTLKTKYEGEATAKINEALFTASMLGELATIPGLKISPSDIAGTAKSLLLSKYGYAKSGDYGIELRQKDHPNMKVLIGNSSKEMTLKDALLEIAKERGWIEEKTEDGKGGGKVVVVPGKAGTLNMIAPHLQSVIAKKIATEK